MSKKKLDTLHNRLPRLHGVYTERSECVQARNDKKEHSLFPLYLTLCTLSELCALCGCNFSLTIFFVFVGYNHEGSDTIRPRV